MEVKQFWIEEDDYSKPHRFVFESDHLATVQALQSRIVELERSEKRLKTIRIACGYVGNGSSSTVKIFQDDATYCWHMISGSFEADSEHGGFNGVIDDFASKFEEDEHMNLRRKTK